MMKTRYIKVIRDLTSDYPKNLALVLAIGLGIFGIGTILGTHAVVSREMTDNYMGTAPASATIEFDGSIPATLTDSVLKFPGIKKAERRATVDGRMKVNDRWYPILLFVIDDFSKMEISKVHYVSGAREPKDGTMLVERTALSMMQAAEGEQVVIKMSDGNAQPLTITGVVHDPGLAPAWQQQTGYAYISLNTLHMLGESQGFNLLRIQVSEDQYSSQAITAKAEELSGFLAKSGYTIHEIQVPPPGKHPHQGQMTGVLRIFIFFAYVILVLGSILVATSMATLMVKQVRQIGVMKTIGGKSFQVVKLYLFMILVICVTALLVGMPLGWIAVRMFSAQIAGLLNLELRNTSIPLWVSLAQIGSGIVVPVLITSIPVIRGSVITVRTALDNFGVASKKQRLTIFAKLVSRLSFVTETYRLALRNTTRQRSRLILTLSLLAAGGAMFMTALNVSKAWDKQLSQLYVQRLYDQEIRFTERVNADSVLSEISALDGVRAAEGWEYSPTSVVKDSDFEITRTYPDKGHGSFSMIAVPIPTQMLNPVVVEGRWLSDENLNDVVLNQGARGIGALGDEIALTIDGKPSRWKIVGFTEDVGSSATAYVSRTAFTRLTGTTGKVKALRIAYTNRSREAANMKNREVDKILEDHKVGVNASIPVWLLHNAVAGHMKVMINTLIAMAIMMGIVGTLGLMSAVSMSVLERTREIGVMRAIGATPQKIRSLIVWEGLTIGLFSIALAFVVSLLISYYLGRFIGHISFGLPLSLTISLLAFVIWILIVTIGSYVASVVPARKANRVTTREALGYE